jgi:hypothetical protein
MGALTIAFDTTIVGALAMPWVAMVIHLFFFSGERSIVALLRWVRKQNQPAVAGVLLFAITYSLGSGVSRIAKDFFNDDDLHLQFRTNPPLMIRVGVTENRILASVYCKQAPLLQVGSNRTDSHSAASPHAGTDPLSEEIRMFTSRSPKGFMCQHTSSWALLVKPREDDKEDENYENDEWLYDIAADIFGLQENALMEKGADYTVRLRQLHDQVMVLRGVAFNGVLGFSLCLFAWSGQVRCRQPRSALRWALAVVPGIYLALTVIALLHHIFRESGLSEPPFLEYTLLLLGAAGAWLAWWRPPEQKPEEARRNGHPVLGNSDAGPLAPAGLSQAGPSPADPSQAGSSQTDPSQGHAAEAKEADTDKRKGRKYCWQTEPWGRYALLSLILTGAAIFGWWSTEVLYAEQVIYSYNSQGPAAPKK